MRLLPCTVLLALAATTGFAQAQTVDGLEILEFGIYDETERAKEKSPTTATGYVGYVSDYKLVERTETVCAKLDVSFGVEYVVSGSPRGATTQIDWITRFPPQGVVTASGQRRATSELRSTTPLGVRTYRSYIFDEPWELVIGIWTLEFYHQGRKLAEKSFNVVECKGIS